MNHHHCQTNPKKIIAKRSSHSVVCLLVLATVIISVALPLVRTTTTSISVTAFTPSPIVINSRNNNNNINNRNNNGMLLLGRVIAPSSLLLSRSVFQRVSATTTTTTSPSFSRLGSQLFMSSSSPKEQRKAGVASPEELRAFVEKAGDDLLVVDVRNPDKEMEPGDQKSFAVAGLPSENYRPKAINLIWDRNVNSMPLPPSDKLMAAAEKDTPIITHCGGGGRGQKAKDFLEANGFTNVLNGGGPKETECWAEFGDK